MSAKCINLWRQFGKTYRIGYDPAYDPRHVPRDKLDPWAMLILCQRGEIWPHGGTTLAVEVEGRRPITVRRLQATGMCTLHRDGSDGATLLFDVRDFETIARIVQPRLRRQVSEAQRQAARERRLARHRQNPSPERSRDAPRPGRASA